MSEKLLRLERLFAVLDARKVAKAKRARYLSEQVGHGISYWSGLLSGARPFGEKVARQIEDKLNLVRGSLEEHGLAPDAAALAAAFDSLPVDTPDALEIRRRIYIAIMGMIAASAPVAANTPPPGPGSQPSAPPTPHQ